ncbi:hypothetical protein [Mariniblastus fucicola]|uniref:hypothetical protein n=1 Tax=Mariniblastus fucicola TaxID=980251 RepID=UPI0011DFA7E7|nr:hypothetical protein [Mariniblastus fucicola]
MVTLLVCIVTALGVKIDEEAAGCIIGLIAAQLLLSAVWVVMGRSSFWFRFCSGAAATTLLVGCFYRVAWRDGGGHGTGIAIAVPMLIQWVLIQIPLWSARFFGWRVATRNQQASNNNRSELQFGTRQLLVWTTIVAISIALIKLFVSRIDLSTGGGAGVGNMELELAAHLTIGNSLIALPVVWGAFTNRWAAIWFIASVGMCALVTFAQISMSSFGGGGDYSLLVLANVVQTFVSIVVMILVRMLGYRLVRAAPDRSPAVHA